MGDDAAEEFFMLAAAAGLEHVKVVISPTDFRTERAAARPRDSAGLDGRACTGHWRSELAQYPRGS